MRKGRALAGALIIPLLLSRPVAAESREEKAILRSQGAIGTSIPEIELTDADSRRFSIARFRGKPLLISLVYTGCADVCPTVVESLAAADRTAQETFGQGSYNILTVGFDSRNDTPDRMRTFARAHRAGGENWIFAAADPASLDRLTNAVGFDYFASAGGFEHAAQVTVVDAGGRVYSQIYGGTFQPPAVMEPLKSLIFGGSTPVFSLGGLGDRMKFFCTVYDPRTGRYYFSYGILLSAAIGALCLLGVLAFLLRELRKNLGARRV
jgi:protein SCO1/2